MIDPTGAVTEFCYDHRGNLTWERDPNGNVTERVYDARSRLVQERFADGAEHDYRYDGLDRLVWERDGNGHISRTEYTPSGDVSAVVDALQNFWSYVYDVEGNLQRIMDPDGRRRTQVVNEVDWVLEETDREGRITATNTITSVA